jgi:DNA-binding transcriptional regulator YhcF (GntR family)
MAVLVCRHERKGGGDVGESGRGTSAISGDVDIILQLRRPEGNQPSSRRVIESLSRYTETPEKVVIELTDEGFILLGDEEAVSVADALRKVSAHLHEQFGQKETGPTIDEIVQELDLKRTHVQRALRELEQRHEVRRSGQGKRGDPSRYSLVPEKVSAHTNGVYGQKRIETASEAVR